MHAENSGEVDNSEPGIIHLPVQTFCFDAGLGLPDARMGAHFLACAERQQSGL